MIEATRCSGLNDDIATVAVHAMFATNAGVEAALVAEMLEVLYHEDTLAHLCRRHPVGCTIDHSAVLRKMPLPLHPGPRTYFEHVAPAEPSDLVRGSLPAGWLPEAPARYMRQTFGDHLAAGAKLHCCALRSNVGEGFEAALRRCSMALRNLGG